MFVMNSYLLFKYVKITTEKNNLTCLTFVNWNLDVTMIYTRYI
jgi:hypothetical protein